MMGRLLKMKNSRTREFGSVSISINPKAMRQSTKYEIQFAYGQREILLDFVGLERSNILIGILQHGVRQMEITPDYSTYGHSKAPRIHYFGRSHIWVYSEGTKDYLKGCGIKKVEAIGAPWNYLPHNKFRDYSLDLIESQERYIVFPDHGHLNMHVQITKEAVREKILYWRRISGHHNLSVCLYWSEFLIPAWQEVCKEEEVNLLTAGIGFITPAWAPNLLRIEFLHNLSKILQRHTHAIFERDTSGIFYAISLGLTVGYFPQTKPFTELEQVLPAHQTLIMEFPEILEQFVEADNLMSRCHKLLGYESMRTRTELKSILRYEDYL